MPTIEFRIDVGGIELIPHSFIVMDNGAGEKRAYGLGPADGRSSPRPGIISDNSRHEYQITTGPFKVTSEQYNKMVGYITECITDPPSYRVSASINGDGVKQCSRWLNAVAQAGGLDWGGFTWNPYGQTRYIGVEKASDAIRSLCATAATAALSHIAPLVPHLDGEGTETARVKLIFYSSFCKVI